jgi:hypothetical protein
MRYVLGRTWQGGRCYPRRDVLARRRAALPNTRGGQYDKLGHGSRPDGQLHAGRGSWHMALERGRASGRQEQGSSPPTPRNGAIPLHFFFDKRTQNCNCGSGAIIILEKKMKIVLFWTVNL